MSLVRSGEPTLLGGGKHIHTKDQKRVSTSCFYCGASLQQIQYEVAGHDEDGYVLLKQMPRDAGTGCPVRERRLGFVGQNGLIFGNPFACGSCFASKKSRTLDEFRRFRSDGKDDYDLRRKLHDLARRLPNNLALQESVDAMIATLDSIHPSIRFHGERQGLVVIEIGD